jgi:hypothetical protein
MGAAKTLKEFDYYRPGNHNKFHKPERVGLSWKYGSLAKH